MISKYFLVVLLLCSIHEIEARDTSNNSFGTVGNRKKCYFQVDEESAKYFAKWLKILDGMLAHLEIRFINNKTYNATEDVLFPKRWIWTFVPPGGGNFYISWPIDYYVYSFGLLDTHTLNNPVKLYVNATPPDCTITFGDPQTVQELGTTLYHMSKKYKFYKINDFYEYSYWCYISTNSKFRDSTVKNLNRYLGVPLQLFGYKCCRNSDEKRRVDCNTEDSDVWNPYQLLPFYIGIIFFTYFPVALVKCGQLAVDSGKKINRLDTEYSDLSDEDTEYIFLKRRGPISVSKLILGLFGLAEKHPILASRIRRVVFVCLTPFVVYIFIIIYYRKGHDLMVEIVKHKIPSGFVSILGGFKESMDLYLPMFGGPAISLILYIIIGLIVILIPRDLSEILELGLPPDKYRYSTLLKLDVATVEAFSQKNCQTVRGYRKVYAVMRGNIYMLINPLFWFFIISYHLTRWRTVIEILCPCCLGKISRIIICAPVLMFYISFCIIETVLFCIYNGFPVCFFVTCTIRGYARYFRRTQRSQTCMSYVILSIIFPICFLFYMFMLIMIILESFTIIGYFIFFIYLSLVIFPSRSFGFVYYVIMFILYVHNMMKDFEKEYQDLLNYSIKASIKLERASMATQFLTRRTNTYTKCCATEFIAMTNKFPPEITPSSLSVQCSDRTEYVKYKKQIPGVRKDLFQFVIEKYCPVHIAFFYVIIQILVVQILVLASIVFIATYIKNVSSRDASEVLNVMSVIIVTMIPNMIRLFFVHVHNKKLRKRKVRQRVIDFWEMKSIAENDSN